MKVLISRRLERKQILIILHKVDRIKHSYNETSLWGEYCRIVKSIGLKLVQCLLPIHTISISNCEQGNKLSYYKIVVDLHLDYKSDATFEED